MLTNHNIVIFRYAFILDHICCRGHVKIGEDLYNGIFHDKYLFLHHNLRPPQVHY